MKSVTYKYIRLAAVASMLFGVAGVAVAATVAGDANILLTPVAGGAEQTVVIKNGSQFNTLVVNSKTLQFTMGGGQETVLTSATGREFNNNKSIKTSCSSTSQLNIKFDNETVVIVELGGSCTSGGGGSSSGTVTPPPPPAAESSSTPPPAAAGSGSGSPATTTPPPAETTPPAVTPPPAEVTQPPAPAVDLPVSELAFGAEGDDVTRLQTLLATDPEVYPEGKITGYFGPLTRAAVRKFQEKYGLPAVGRVGPLTLAKLAEVFTGGSAAPAATPPPAPTGGKLTRELQMGDEGDDVTQLQLFLAQDTEVYPEGKVTGYFGALTKAAVKRFQAKYGIAQVGRVGPLTLAKLNELMQ
ncbi:MAG: peptidoglycan-binding protein [Candidatus Ryanbacteria bacterium]|nr:peptidoglycan-binding protein [Candidatus Ryanbacteria bacterium]